MSGQHHKGKKRPRKWHRSWREGRRWLREQRALPEVESGADPTEGGPEKLRRGAGKRTGVRGDAI